MLVTPRIIKTKNNNNCMVGSQSESGITIKIYHAKEKQVLPKKQRTNINNNTHSRNKTKNKQTRNPIHSHHKIQKYLNTMNLFTFPLTLNNET